MAKKPWENFQPQTTSAGSTPDPKPWEKFANPEEPKKKSTQEPSLSEPQQQSQPAITQPKQPLQPTSGKGFIGTIKDAFNSLVTDYNTVNEEKVDKPSPILNAIKRGMNLGSQAEIVSAFSAEKPNEEKLQKLAQIQKENQELPASKAYDKFNQSKSVGESLSSLAENPVQIIGELTVESLAGLANYGTSRMAVGAGIGAAAGSVVPGIGTAAGAGAGIIAGLADTSLALEFTGSFIESLQEAGIDVTDPKQLQKAFEDDDLISSARSHAYKKGIPIAIFDLISGGIAGKIATQPAKSLAKKIALGAGEFAAQGALGGAGEAAGQLTAGEDLNSSAIIAEIIGELGTTPIEVSANLLGRTKSLVNEANQPAPTESTAQAPTEPVSAQQPDTVAGEPTEPKQQEDGKPSDQTINQTGAEETQEVVEPTGEAEVSLVVTEPAQQPENINQPENEITQQLPNTLSPKEKQGSIKGGEVNVESIILTDSVNKESTGLSEKKIKLKEKKSLSEYAKNKGIWISDKFGKPDKTGSEQDIYFNEDENKVVKVNPNVTHRTWKDYFNTISIHNTLFPEATYEIKGFTNHNNRFSVVVEQPMIEKGSTPATPDEISAKVKELGFTESDEYGLGTVFVNKEMGVKLSDLHDENVLKGADGKLYFIDPVIEFTEERENHPEKFSGPQSPETIDTTSETPQPTSETIIPSLETVTAADLQTGKTKPSSYYDRMVEDEALGEAIQSKSPEYQEQSLTKAIEVSNKIVDDAIAKNDVDKLYSDTLKNWNKIPALMQVNLAERLMDHYARVYDDSKLTTLYDLIGAEAAAERGRSVKAYDTGRGEVEKASTAAIAEHSKQKKEAIGTETEEKLNKLFDELKIKDKELAELKEKLSKKIAEVEKILSSNDKGLKNRIANRKKTVDSAKAKLNSLKADTKGKAYASLDFGLTPVLWNTAIDTINASLDAGLTLANAIDQAITAVQQKYKGEWDPEGFKAYIKQQLREESDGLNVDMKSAVKKGLKDIGVQINNLIDSHYREIENAGKKLSDRFVDELGLDEVTAKQLEKDVINTLTSIVKERQQKALSQRLGSEPIPSKSKIKKKDLFDNIISDVNKGALNDDLFSDLFADYYGFSKVTPEARQMLLDYAEKLDKLANYPEIYNRTVNQFWNDMKKAGLDKNTMQSVYTDFLYHGALSGISTQSRSIKGSLMTNLGAMLSVTLASPKNAKEAWTQFLKGLPVGLQNAYDVMRTGYRADQFYEYKPKGDSYITQKVNTPMSELIKDKDWGGVFTKLHMTVPTYMIRALSAWDAITTAGNIKFHGYMMAANRYIGNGNSEKTRLYSEATEKKLRDQAQEDLQYLKSEGFEIPKAYIGNRVEELRNQLIDENITKRIYQRSSEAVLLSDPHGTAGVFYRWMQGNLSEKQTDTKMMALSKMFGKSVFLIMRVPANFINMNLDYSPYGYVRALRGTIKYREGVYQMSPEERRIAIIKATTGSAVAMTMAMMLFDWDDDEDKLVLPDDAPIRIWGRGMDKFDDNKSIDARWKPWSVQFKLPNGEWSDFYSFIDNPMGMMLAPLGMISDEVRIKDFQKTVKEEDYEIPERNLQYYGSLFANSSAGFLMEQSYNQGMRDVRDILLPYGNDYTRSGEKLEKIATRPIKTIAFPNIYAQLYNYSKSGLDEPEKYAKSVQDKLIKGTPIIESVMLNDDVDMFGYPVIKRFDVPLVPDMVLTMVKENIDYREGLPEWQLVHKYPEVIVHPFKMPKSIDGRGINESYELQFKQLAGDRFNNLVNKRYNKLDKLESYKLQVQLNMLRNSAYEGAKSDIVKIIKKEGK